MRNDITVIISCAGMGTRLGIGTTKALVEVAGKPLIIRQLELLNEVEDVRIVVGFQAEKVINTVKLYRSDIIFVFNHDYKTTGTAASLSKGLIGTKKYVVSLDGDLLVHPDDMSAFLDNNCECIGGCIPTTDNPVLMTLDKEGSVVKFSREQGKLEWTGLAKIKANKLTPDEGHVYQMLEPLMPIKVIEIRAKEIDTINDYEAAVCWVENGYR